ncbi:zinc-binding dehydrogenase [Thermodesulfobacteriota bacterium]
MKAAKFKPPRSFGIENLPEPQNTPDSVIVKVKAAGICGSDLHVWNLGAFPNAIMGHEFSGDVVEVGADVDDVKVGDRVAAMSGKGCGECRWCRQGEFVRCKKLELVGYELPGAFAEYVRVPSFVIGRNAAFLPDHLTYGDGATAEPLSVALYAYNQTRPQLSDSVIVVGLGIIGLFLVQILKSKGIHCVIASGRRARRLQVAKEYGADVVVDAATDDVKEIVNDMTRRDGVDVVFDTAGTPKTLRQCLKMVHRGGKINVVGIAEEPLSINSLDLVAGDITLIGCGLKFDIPGAVELLETGQVSAKSLITHEYPLEEIVDAFHTQKNNQEAIKVQIKI